MKIHLCDRVAVEAEGKTLPDSLLGGHQGRLALAFLVMERHRSVPREELAEVLWPEALPASWSGSLSAVVSKLRRLLTEAGLDGPAALAAAFGCYRLHLPNDTWVDAEVAAAAVSAGEQALAGGDAVTALAQASMARSIAGGLFLPGEDCAWVDAQRARLQEVLVRALHCQAEAHLASGEAVQAIGPAVEVVSVEQFREAGWRLLMRAHAAAGDRAEALRVWERCRRLLVEELGASPSPETEAVYFELLRQDTPSSPRSLPTGVVTFLLTDIEGSATLWERDATAMTAVLERHDQLIADAVIARGGTTIKAQGEGDSTLSVFRRASEAAAAALEVQASLAGEPWPSGTEPKTRMALHTGEAVERDGDYFGPALNRAARLRGLAHGGQILASQAVAEVVLDHLPAGTELRSLGHRELRGLTRGEQVFHRYSTCRSTSQTSIERSRSTRECSRASPDDGATRSPMCGSSVLSSRCTPAPSRLGHLPATATSARPLPLRRSSRCCIGSRPRGSISTCLRRRPALAHRSSRRSSCARTRTETPSS